MEPKRLTCLTMAALGIFVLLFALYVELTI